MKRPYSDTNIFLIRFLKVFKKIITSLSVFTFNRFSHIDQEPCRSNRISKCLIFKYKIDHQSNLHNPSLTFITKAAIVLISNNGFLCSSK